LRYVESKKTLVAAAAVGLNHESIAGVGLDLFSQEPGFQRDWLREPNRLRTLKEFSLKGLQADQAAFYPIADKDEIIGIVIVPIPKQHAVNEERLQNGYLLSCLHTLKRQMDILDIQSRLKKFSIYDEVSEALSAEIFIQKVREEVSRARRLSRPVTILLVALDGLVDLSLEQSQHNLQDLLRGVADLLRKNSRMNDMVGRVSPDQFALCLPHTDKRGGAIKAERIRRLIEASDFSALIGNEKHVTVSIGVSEYPANCHDAEALFQTAEGAVIEIRKVGFNRVCVASPPARFVPDFVVNDAKISAPNSR
jgi:diguanylate cyclase (GGDEF)-like protein